MKNTVAFVPITIISLLQILVLASASVNITTNLKAPIDQYCDYPYSVQSCIDGVNIQYFPDICTKWDELKECMESGSCRSSYITSQKITFEFDNSVTCVGVQVETIGRYPNQEIRVTGKCSRRTVSCSLNMNRLNCVVWHALRQCFDKAVCNDKEVDTIKKEVIRNMSENYCGAGSLIASVGTIIMAVVLLLTR